MDADSPFISILIVNYNGLALVEDCLSSIFAQDWKDFEVVMVDNGSSDGSAELVERDHPSVRVARAGKNLGFAGGNNFGLPHCRGRHVFLLNNDTRLEPGTLGALADGIRKHPRYRVFACFMLSMADPSLVDSAGDSIYTAGSTFNFAGYPASIFQAPREVTSACAGAAVYEAALLRELGGFDEDFFLIFEDVDLSLRARHRGESILFLPEARVLHKGSASLGGRVSGTTLYYSDRNFPLLFLKNFPLPVLLRVLPGLLLMKLLRLVLAFRAGHPLLFARSTWDSLRLAPAMLAKRRSILGNSRLAPGEFGLLLRKGWLRERLAFKRGDFNIPL